MPVQVLHQHRVKVFAGVICFFLMMCLPATAKDDLRPLEGKGLELFVGDWIHLGGEPTNEVIAANISQCDLHLIPPENARIHWPDNANESVPGLFDAKGHLSFLDIDGRLMRAVAGRTRPGRIFGDVHALAYVGYRQNDVGLIVSSVPEYSFSPVARNWPMTQAGTILAQGTPYVLAVDTGLIKPDYALLMLGKNASGRDVGLLYQPVTRKGEIISGETRQYFRCGDVSAISGR